MILAYVYYLIVKNQITSLLLLPFRLMNSILGTIPDKCLYYSFINLDFNTALLLI